MENLQPKKLSNVQLELLKLYERNISDKDLIELKDHIGLFFLDRYVKKADEAWEKKWMDRGYHGGIPQNKNEEKNTWSGRK